MKPQCPLSNVYSLWKHKYRRYLDKNIETHEVNAKNAFNLAYFLVSYVAFFKEQTHKEALISHENDEKSFS